jgi:hypothetical protein
LLGETTFSKPHEFADRRQNAVIGFGIISLRHAAKTISHLNA